MEERRRHARFLAELPIEIREKNTSFPLRGATSDVSVGGCYVATIFPLAVGSHIEFTLHVGDDRIMGSGKVETSHPSVGMGIRFIGLSETSKSRLHEYLSGLEANYSEQTLRTFLR